MSIALSDLIQRLKDDVPQVDGVPTVTQYDRAAKSAVAAFSRECGMQKVVTIAVVANTAEYNLPTDFMELISIEDPSAEVYRDEGVIVTSNGLVPVGADWEEEHYITGGSPPTITFYPTPTYDQDRDIWYRAEYELVTDAYPTLDEESVEVTLLLAASTALGSRATIAAEQAWTYQQGDVRVSKERLASALKEQAAAKLKEYERRVKKLNMSVGRRARYNVSGR